MHATGLRVHEALPINGIRMHCLDYEADAPPMLLLHSLSGNSRLFDGLVSAGLTPAFRLLVPDLRGRGRTEAPLCGYSLDDGCLDLIALLDHFGIERIAVCGHSFGGLLGLYFAARYPDRVSRLVILDAAAEMHPAAPAMTALAAARLDTIISSTEGYLSMIKAAPFVDRWYEEMRGFVMADIQPLGLGVHTTSSRSYTAVLASLHVYSNSTQDWRAYAAQVSQPALLIQARDPFFMGMPMLSEQGALDTVASMKHARYARVTGNHFSMLYGPGAAEITLAIASFFAETAADADAGPAAA